MRDTRNTRDTRDTVVAVLHFVAAALHLPWLAVHVLVLLALSRVPFFRAGAPVVVLSLMLYSGAACCLIVGGVGLLGGRRWARTVSLLYAVLGAGAALMLWLAGAKLWFTLILLAYPFLVGYLYIRPPEPVAGSKPDTSDSEGSERV